jgi:hypothetical protein
VPPPPPPPSDELGIPMDITEEHEVTTEKRKIQQDRSTVEEVQEEDEYEDLY